MKISRMIQHRPHDTKGTMKKLVKELKPFWLMILAVALLSIFANVLSLLGPYFCGEAINEASRGKGMVDFNALWKWALLMLFSYVLSSLVSLGINMIMVVVSKKSAFALREKCFEKLHRLPVSVFDSESSGDILSRISYDCDVVALSIQADISQILSAIITVTGAFVMMVKISLPLSCVTMVTIPITVIYTIYIKGQTRPLYSKRSQEYGVMNGFVEEMFSGEKTIQAYGYEEKISEEFAAVNTKAADAYWRADHKGVTIGPTMGMMNNLSLALNGTLGSVLYMMGRVTLGQISSFILYSRKFAGPINETANILNEVFSALSAAERIFSFLEIEEEAPDQDGAETDYVGRGDVELKSVSFSYVEGRKVLDDVSVSIPKGKLLAIVGPTGAGKTTIINLLMRFYDQDGGEILYDGKPSFSYGRRCLRRQYAMVLQDTWLFKGTVRENIAYGRENATLEEVVDAARKARIHNFIMSLPLGYDTVISEDGGNISKGQKQLLTIARAFLSDSPVLILDEATSNVDTSTEKAVQEAMEVLMEGRTSIVIAHRLSTIEHADEIIVVKDGRIAERGRHEELMAKKGVYWGMYRSQFS